MSALLDSILPIGSTLFGGLGGFIGARSQQMMELSDKKDERESNERLENLRLAHNKDIQQSELNIRPTYRDRFLGIKWNEKSYGIEYKAKSETLLMSPVNLFKFGIAGLFTYTYCYIWQYYAINPEKSVKTALPEPDGWTIDLLGLKLSSFLNVIAELNLGGLAATTMAQPALMIITYVVTNLTYKQISQR